MRKIVLVADDIRSSHNVGSLFRLADGMAVEKLYLCGYTPYPEAPGDSRLPHISRRAAGQIHKTALGAEKNVKWAHCSDALDLLRQLSKEGYVVAALEQTPASRPLASAQARDNIALVVGSEIGGLSPAVLEASDIVLSIPMLGKKESFNVATAAAMAVYHFRHCQKK